MKSIFAGIMVSIGGCVYLSCDNYYVGAVLFTVALLTICITGMKLFTGEVGFLAFRRQKIFILSVLRTLVGNIIGTAIGAALVMFSNPYIMFTAQRLVESKLEKTWWMVLASATLCGILMAVAVWSYRHMGMYIPMLFCIPTFILCGFEHSIANMFYFFIDGVYTPYDIIFIALTLAGNAIGGLFAIKAIGRIDFRC